MGCCCWVAFRSVQSKWVQWLWHLCSSYYLLISFAHIYTNVVFAFLSVRNPLFPPYHTHLPPCIVTMLLLLAFLLLDSCVIDKSTCRFWQL